MNQEQEIIEVLEDLVWFVHQSHGIAGFPLNGDIAFWDDLAFVDRAKSLLETLKARNNSSEVGVVRNE